MATLTDTTIASTYKQLLKLTSEGVGADASAKYVEDGLGTDTALSLSTTRVGIGTSSPSNESSGTLLHIADTGDSNAAHINMSGGDGANGSQTGKISFSDPGDVADAVAFITGRIKGTNASPGGEIAFYSGIDGGAMVQNFVLDSNSRISLSNNDSGNTGNTIFGKSAWNNSSNNSSDYNTIFGEGVMGTGAVAGAVENTGVGYEALKNLTSGDENTMIGRLAGRDITTGSGNVMIGSAAGYQVDGDVSKCVIIGRGAVNDTAGNEADGTVAIGYGALYDLTTGAGNVAIGYQSGEEITSGSRNTLLGYQTLIVENAVNDLTLVGYHAGTAISNSATVGSVLIGSYAGASITSGAKNIAIGYNAGKILTTGGENVIIGHNAFDAADGGEGGNIIIGRDAGGAIDHDDSDDNVIIGNNAGVGGDAAVSACIAIGKEAMTGTADDAQSGTVAIGHKALTALTSGAENTAVGFEAGKAMTTGSNLTAVGYQAGLVLPAGANANTAIGAGALKAGNAGTTDHNTCVGYLAGDAITDGSQNTIIGSGAACLSGGGTNQSALGYGAAARADNSVSLGNGSVTTVYMADDGAAVMYANGTINTSDIRFKENVEDTDLGLEFINKVRPVKYDFKDDKHDEKKRYGIIAQEVLGILKDLDKEDFAGIKTDNPDKLGADYIQFVAPLIKAVQELSQQIEDLKKKVG